MRWYDKMLYALAHSIPGRTMWERVNLGRVVMACTGIALVGEVLAIVVPLTGANLFLPSGEVVLWGFIIVSFLVIRHFTISVEEIEELEVSYRERSKWTRWSWGVVVSAFVVIPFVLIVWANLFR